MSSQNTGDFDFLSLWSTLAVTNATFVWLSSHLFVSFPYSLPSYVVLVFIFSSFVVSSLLAPNFFFPFEHFLHIKMVEMNYCFSFFHALSFFFLFFCFFCSRLYRLFLFFLFSWFKARRNVSFNDELLPNFDHVFFVKSKTKRITAVSILTWF